MPDFERSIILDEAHGGPTGGHYARKEKMQKILCAGLWWPMLHKDTKVSSKACDACQRTGKPSWRDKLPLNP